MLFEIGVAIKISFLVPVSMVLLLLRFLCVIPYYDELSYMWQSTIVSYPECYLIRILILDQAKQHESRR